MTEVSDTEMDRRTFHPVQPEIEWRDVNSTGRGPNLYECPTCGAVVVKARVEDHYEWHRKEGVRSMFPSIA